MIARVDWNEPQVQGASLELPYNDRELYCDIERGRRKNHIQPNPGRIQQLGTEEYLRLMYRLVKGLWVEIDEPQVGYRVLELFDGFVDLIQGDVAFVTLKSQFGDILQGEYPTAELASRGIYEGRSFRCLTIESDGCVTARLESIPDVTISAAEQQALCDGIETATSENWLE